MIKSIGDNQHTLIQDIIALHGKDGLIVDPTYSKGNLYKDVDLKFDISPQTADTIKADCRHLPLSSNSVVTIIFDPPFLATTGPSLGTSSGNIINKRFSVFPSERELFQFYNDSLVEFWRILQQDGILIFKCQDKVSSGKQYFSHCWIWQKAIEIGLYPIDLFVLIAKNRIVAHWQRKQKHARKFHSYFWVLKKVDKKVRYV